MARLKLLEKDEVEPIAREIYEKAEASSGKVLNLFKVLAHSPKIVRDWNRLGTTLLYKGTLAADIRELAIIRVGELAGSAYELAAHRRIGLGTGLTQAQIDDIGAWEDSANFSERERTVLKYTDELAQNIRASDQTFADLQSCFNARDIVELTVAIGYYGMVARTLESLDVDPEE
jgi:alkylhydroperoxidase family enzyme